MSSSVRGIWLLLAFFWGCDELLPPRADPERVLVGTLFPLEGATIIRSGEQSSITGSFFIQVTNVYDEVLQDQARIGGRGDVWMRDQPQNRGVFDLTRSDLMNGNIILAGHITLGPDSSANFLKRWSHHTLNGEPFWGFVRLTPRTTASGESYLESDPIRFVARASVQVFERVQPLEIEPVEFTLTYWVF